MFVSFVFSYPLTPYRGKKSGLEPQTNYEINEKTLCLLTKRSNPEHSGYEINERNERTLGTGFSRIQKGGFFVTGRSAPQPSSEANPTIRTTSASHLRSTNRRTRKNATTLEKDRVGGRATRNVSSRSSTLGQLPRVEGEENGWARCCDPCSRRHRWAGAVEAPTRSCPDPGLVVEDDELSRWAESSDLLSREMRHAIAAAVRAAGGTVDDARDLSDVCERLERDWQRRADRMRLCAASFAGATQMAERSRMVETAVGGRCDRCYGRVAA